MENEKIFQVPEELQKELKEKNPSIKIELLTLTLDDGKSFEAVLKRPSNASISRYVTALGVANRQGKDTGQIHLRFVFDNILAPTAEEFSDLVEKNSVPLLPISIANDLVSGSGMSVDSKKKLL